MRSWWKCSLRLPRFLHNTESKSKGRPKSWVKIKAEFHLALQWPEANSADHRDQGTAANLSALRPTPEEWIDAKECHSQKGKSEQRKRTSKSEGLDPGELFPSALPGTCPRLRLLELPRFGSWHPNFFVRFPGDSTGTQGWGSLVWIEGQ